MSPLPPAVAALAPVPQVPRAAVSAKARLLDLLFPVRCAGCGRAGELLCPACRAQVQPVPQPVCLRCGRPVANVGRCEGCTAGQFHVSAIRAAAVYADPLAQVIHRFKYEGRAELHGPLGELLAGYWRGRVVTVDLVIAVPLHPKRLAERGFNQALEIARPLAAQLGLKPETRHVRRHIDTTPQASLPWKERAKNIRHAFACDIDLSGLAILIIDDVMTTGATLNELAGTLKAHGAARVENLVLARALKD